MSRRPTVRTATSPALRGRSTDLDSRIAHSSWRHPGITLRPTKAGLVVMLTGGIYRCGRWAIRWRDRTTPLALGALTDLFWLPTWQAAAVALATAWPATKAFPKAPRRRAWRAMNRRWARWCGDAQIAPPPTIVRFSDRPEATTLVVEPHQTTKPEAFIRQRSTLGNAARAECRIHELTPGRWSVTLRRVDTLAIEPTPPEFHTLIPTSLPIGRDATGQEITAPIFEAHWLVAGASGAGKSTFLNHVIASLLACEWVEIHGIDAQAGVTFKPWEHRFASLATSPETAAARLVELVETLDHRSVAMANEGVSLARPSPRWPMQIVLIDELGQVMRQPDDKLRKASKAAIWKILSLGRKAGFAVIGATQDPRKEVVSGDERANYTHTICLRTRSVIDSNVVLGPGMAGMGWDASTISPTHPGRAFFAAARGVTEVRTYRLVPPLPDALLSPRQPRTVTGDTSQPLKVVEAATASADVADDRPVVPLPPPTTLDMRAALAAELVAAGPAGVTTVHLCDRYGLTPRQVRNHMHRIGARTDGRRWHRKDT